MADPNIFIDALKRKLNLKKDVTLASRIKIEATRISKIRNNDRPISAKLLLLVHQNTGIPLDELKEMMLAPRVKAIARSVVQESVTPTDNSNTRMRYDTDFKLNAVRMVSDSMSGLQVAKQLNVAYTTFHNWIKAYRAGRLHKSVVLSPEEMDYLQRLLKERAAGLRKQLDNSGAKQEKNLIAALRKKLSGPEPERKSRESERDSAEKFPFPAD